MSTVDLRELARRENEQTEWKENVADENDVVRCLCAFANDLQNLGGGYVVCGAAERKDPHGFPELIRSGLTASDLKRIEGTVLNRCRKNVSPPLHPLVEELPGESPDRRILIFTQPATPHAHQLGDGSYPVRVSRETIEARNGILRELLVRKGVAEPWDRRLCATATQADIDLLVLRELLNEARLSIPDDDIASFVSDTRQISALVPPLCVREPLTGTLRPRNFALLLFGKNITRFIPGAYSLYSLYPGVDRTTATSDRHEITGTVWEQVRSLQKHLDMQVSLLMDKNDLRHPNAVKYPQRALYEAVGNALAHRDYELDDPTRVTAFLDRIEFRSPGGLPLGLSLEAFRTGELGPKWRNQALAWFFNKLQIAQGEGQGIPTILRSMKNAGSPPPSFDADQVRVLCVLPAHERHRRESPAT